MMAILSRHNGALDTNPPNGSTYALSVHGSDWLYAVTAVYIVSLLAFIFLTFFKRSGEKIFHYLLTISLFVGAISYYTMASDLGSTPIFAANNNSSNGTREIFYARYINWIFGWVPLIISVGLLSGISWATIFFNIALLWTWTASWLVGAVTATNYKWGFFAFGLLALILLSLSLLHAGRTGSNRIGTSHHYLPLTGFLVFLWMIYPIAYGLSDGGNKISVTSEFIFFGILDLLTVPLLSFAFLFLSRSWDYDALHVNYTTNGRVLNRGVHGNGRLMREKNTTVPVAGNTV